MRWIVNISNFIVTGLILWAMTRIFPEQVKIDGFWHIVLSVIVLWIIEIAVQLFGAILTISGIASASCLVAILGVFSMMLAKFIALYIMDAALTGFTMRGFWLKLITACACSILCISYKSSRA